MAVHLLDLERHMNMLGTNSETWHSLASVLVQIDLEMVREK